ncbi:helix-turn-helix transcriptional regulator [Niabella drilacis]|uniref:HTH cro/C1-type domain-containing protein n=1 Tax=Niabella drilacis (strain DSM 25811 / CCM 8410 / CCUG 62505 / LMG 26954 / E90) TaxID=1285928 RepID=A0A1G6N6J0_NIADE|nr:transcriptional regulator [Niabella drilacis]SDC63433.1 hypothetical protein SAMN04487894_103172 [Niabella drilacis]
MSKERNEIEMTHVWNKEKTNALKDFILSHSERQSKERRLKNELLAIQYQIEDYIEDRSTDKNIKILDFVKMYLAVFEITQKKLANLFEMQDSNLHKYLTGERRLNTDVLLKLSSFSHTEPEYWLRIEIKNELFEITREKNMISAYKKYNYQNLLATEIQ